MEVINSNSSLITPDSSFYNSTNTTTSSNNTSTTTNDINYSSDYSESYIDDSECELSSLINLLKDKIACNDFMIKNIKYPQLLLLSLQELDDLVGMDRLKDSISLQVMRLIDSLNNGESSAKMLNSILYGPPGVGKTKVGIILAKIWFSLGYLKKPTSKVSTKTIGSIPGTPPMPVSDDLGPLLLILGIVLFYGAAYILSGVKFLYNSIGLFWLLIILGTIIIIFSFVYYNKNTYNWIENKIINITNTEKDYNNVAVLENISDRDIITVVSRDDFVAGYLGQSAIKTKALLNANLGKVLFIDEAYSLLNDPRDSFGMEALTTLNLFMSENPNGIAVIFAGYKDLMQHGIFSFQPGLPRRCMWHFECDEYGGEELYQIFVRQVKKDGWSIREKDKARIEKLICDNDDLFSSFGGDTERVLFYSQLEASKRNIYKSSNSSSSSKSNTNSSLYFVTDSSKSSKSSSGSGGSKSSSGLSSTKSITSDDRVINNESNNKTLSYNHVKEGIRRLRENNIKS